MLIKGAGRGEGEGKQCYIHTPESIGSGMRLSRACKSSRLVTSYSGSRRSKWWRDGTAGKQGAGGEEKERGKEKAPHGQKTAAQQKGAILKEQPCT